MSGSRPPLHRPGPALGPGPEFDLIRGFFASPDSHRPDGVRVGVGDDCAVVTGTGVALSCDLSVEGIHFRRDWLRVDEIGYRAATAALSDLAAVAARPIGALVALALPRGDGEASAGELMSGVRRALDRVGGVLLGGDVSGSPDRIVLDVTVVGEVSTPVLRRGARIGDELWVTGELGGAGLAVRTWRNGSEPGSSARARFAAPTARIAEARWLADRQLLHAMIDISDGLAGDAAHLAAASAVGVELDASQLPLDPSLHDEVVDDSAQIRLALTGGEDYELCFAAPAARIARIRGEFIETFGIRLTRVGRIVGGAGVVIRDALGEVIPLEPRGYQHFEAPA